MSLSSLRLAAASACLLFAASGPLRAATTFSINDNSGTPNSGSYSAGSTFTLDITLNVVNNTAPNDITGFSLFFDIAQANAAFFSVSSFSLRNTAFSDPTSANTLQNFTFADRNGFLSIPNDLGATTTAGTSVPAGSYLVASVTFAISPNAPAGNYVFQTTPSSAGGHASGSSDSNFAFFTASAAGYTVTVVPEPSTIAFSLAGAGLLGLAMRRRSRA